MLLPEAKHRLAVEDLPRYAHEVLGLGGVNLTTDLLAGADRTLLEGIRERADKAACACLLLIEPEPLPFASADRAEVKGAIDRMTRVVEAAHILGCSSAAVSIIAKDEDLLLAKAADGLRKVVERAERLEINLLVSPHAGLTASADRVSDLIKRVGGFRIGTFPDFEAAAASDDPIGFLHRLTPYATVVSATTIKFVAKKGKGEEGDSLTHKPYDLEPMIEAVRAVSRSHRRRHRRRPDRRARRDHEFDLRHVRGCGQRRNRVHQCRQPLD